MRCMVCKVGDTARGTVTVTLQRGNTVVIVRDAPAVVCQTAASITWTRLRQANCTDRVRKRCGDVQWAEIVCLRRKRQHASANSIRRCRSIRWKTLFAN
jgi:YgiT-type zinc finger domain-containing protein